MTNEPSFTIGIEEEYLLVDKETRDLVTDPPAGLMADCETGARRPGQPGVPALPDRDRHARSAARSPRRAPTSRGCAARSRRARPSTASRRSRPRRTRSPTGACSSTPTRSRYNQLARDMQVVARRLLICGMHVHVGIEDELLRFDLFNQAPYFLPHLLALVDVVAVLARRDRPASILPPVGLQRTAAHRPAAAVREPRRVPPHGRDAGLRRRDRGRHQDLVGSPPVGAVPDAGDADQRRLHAARRCDRHRRALPLHAAHALPPPARQPALARLLRASSSTRTAGSRSASGRRRR